MCASPFALQSSSLTPIGTCCITLVGGSQGSLWIRQSGSNFSVKLVHLYTRVWRSSLADNTACFLTLCLACTHRPGIGLPIYSYYTRYSLETVCGLFRCMAYIGRVGACSIHSMTNLSLNFTSYLLTCMEFIRRDLEKSSNHIVEF